MDTSSNISIPFQIKIPTGESQFTIPLDRHQLKDGYEFHFDYLMLKPNVYSKEAQIQELDPVEEEEYVEMYPFNLDFHYDSTYYNSENFANRYTQDTKTEVDVNTTLQAINKFFAGTKVVGQKWPPVIFDWGFLPGIQSGKDLNEYNKNGLFIFYKVKDDDPTLHDWLPPASRMPLVNNWQYPFEANDPAVAKLLRVRMHLAPNVELGFSNTNLLEAFGFSPKMYTPKVVPNSQIKFSNPYLSDYLTIVGDLPIGAISISTLNRISLYSYKKKVSTPQGVLTTRRKNLTKPEILATDFNNAFSKLAELGLHSLSLTYNPTTKKFKFTYPATQGLKIDINIDPEAAELLGYNRGTHQIKYGIEPSPLRDKFDISNIVLQAMTIVYDVGLVSVYHEDESNYQTLQFKDKVMATLYPAADGTMRVKETSCLNAPKAFVSYFAVPELVFVLKRYSEDSKPVPLSLPTISYITGTLIGRKV